MLAGSKTVASGLILLRKEPGLTSFDSLKAVKRALGTGKAGHTGTLDKFAGGLLLVLTGRALKLSQWFTHCDKQYNGTILFGSETDTLDPEGAVIAKADIPTQEAVETALAAFRGKIEQAPPEYSAIHVGGERASALARRGEAPEMKKRPVEIFRLELTSWEPPFAGISVHCSGGTYIRSLARDIAIAAGSRAHLAALVRTKVAGFCLEDAVSPQEGDWQPAMQPIGKSVFEKLAVRCIDADLETARKIANGKALHEVLPKTVLQAASSPAAVFAGSSLLAVIEKHEETGNWKYGYVYARD